MLAIQTLLLRVYPASNSFDWHSYVSYLTDLLERHTYPYKQIKTTERQKNRQNTFVCILTIIQMPNSGQYQIAQCIAYKSDVFLKLSPILQTLRASQGNYLELIEHGNCAKLFFVHCHNFKLPSFQVAFTIIK